MTIHKLPKLNPMSTAPRCGEVILMVEGRGLVSAERRHGGWYAPMLDDDDTGEWPSTVYSVILGWWPVPDVDE